MRSPLLKKRSLPSKRKQKGAVAIVLGLSLVTLFAMGGVVLDLGHLYVAKSELQNSADAAALAGAMRLNETAVGITNANTDAIAVAAQNNFNFSTSVALTAANVEYGSNPSGPWVNYATALASPAGKTFVRVNTGPQVMDTYLMRVVGPAFNTVSTFGLAVAGRFINNITPIGVCAVDPVNKTAKYTYPPSPAGTGLTELVEFGFRRGVTYDIFKLNPLGGSPADQYLINPTDTPSTGCTPSSSSAKAEAAAAFLCSGNSAVIPTGVGQVYTNTGFTANVAKSLNSRFGEFDPGGKCIAAKAPPDTNIREYPCKRPTGGGPPTPPCVTSATTALPIKWMEGGTGDTGTLPKQQSVLTVSNKPKYVWPTGSGAVVPAPAGQAQFAGGVNDYGVLWSYGPAYQADTSATPKVGAPFTPAEANLNPMYSAAKPPTTLSYFDTTTNGYPTVPGAGFPAGTPAAPYNQSVGSPYFLTGGATGVRNRRILNLVIINCTVAPVPSPTPSCGAMNAVGVGRFFMQTKADTSGFSSLDLEFAGLIDPIPVSEIRLYR